MKLLRTAPSIYYNAEFIEHIVEGPYLGMRKKTTVFFANHGTLELLMNAADFVKLLESGETIIDLTAYRQ